MKTRCPSCGKSSQVPDGELGWPAYCAACGASFEIRAVEQPMTMLPPADLSLSVMPGPNVRVLAAAIIAAAAVMISLMVWAVTRRPSEPADGVLAQARQLVAAAQADVARGDLAGAQVKYKALDRMVVPSTADGRVHDLAPQVLAEQGKLFHLQLAGVIERHLPGAAGPPRTGVVTGSVPGPVESSAPAPPPRPPEPGPAVAAAPASHGPLPFSDVPVPGPGPEAAAPKVDAPPAPEEAAAPRGARRPPVRPMQEASDELTDEQIGASIHKGVDYLLTRFDVHSHMIRGVFDPTDPLARGRDILCVYALMQCGQAIADDRIGEHDKPMKEMIAAMKSLPLGKYGYETYARGLRATALALFNHPEDRGVLMADAGTLVRGANNGAYTYMLGTHDEGVWDNSNSQYGLLGVWSAAELGFEVPEAYWNAVQRHWTQTQGANGQWDYRSGGVVGSQSMTCAGLASLFVTHDYLDPAGFGMAVGRAPFGPQLGRGLKWLEEGSNCLELNHGGYSLYGLERVGLASGFKYFGNNDWFRFLARQAIAEQAPDGSWADGEGEEVATAYELLFLSRGRHPIVMNKLRFDGYWANRPRDVANLARFVSHQLERPLNWQVVPLDHDWTDWMDSPILYLASHQAPRISEDDVRRIRAFVENGGLLFTQADGDSLDFNAFAHDLSRRLFPAYEMQDLPANHPLCNVLYKLRPAPPLKYVTNGSRVLMLHATTDLSKYWQLRDDKHMPFPFELGTNLFIYAAGKSELRNRLVSTVIPPPRRFPRAQFTVARLKYAGNWDPEPAAWERFTRWMQRQTGYGLQVVTLRIGELRPESQPIAHLTGTAAYDLSDGEVAALKRYVESGGMLFVDLCGGSGAFDQSLQAGLYRRAFADHPSQVMGFAHPMLNVTGDGMDNVSKPRLRPFAVDALGNHAGYPEIIKAGRGHVVFTSLDVTSGLLGTNTWGILGYEPDYAMALLKNAILWTLDGQPDDAPLITPAAPRPSRAATEPYSSPGDGR